MTEGYIYILFNRAFHNNQLKIGMTTKTPEVRAREISAATGVPQDFEVLWKVRVIDCYRAERLIHQHLDRYRPSKSREFFALPVDEAVGVLNRVADEVGRVQRAHDAKLVVDDQAQSGPSRPLPEITVVSPKQQRKKSGNARPTAVTFDDHASYTDAPTRSILGELRRRVLAAR